MGAKACQLFWTSTRCRACASGDALRCMVPEFAVCPCIATSSYNPGAAVPGSVQTCKPDTLYVDSAISTLQAVLVQPNTAETLNPLPCCLLRKLQHPISDGDLAICIASMFLGSICNMLTAEIACCSLLGTKLHMVVESVHCAVHVSLWLFKRMLQIVLTASAVVVICICPAPFVVASPCQRKLLSLQTRLIVQHPCNSMPKLSLTSASCNKEALVITDKAHRQAY